jgi:alpha,alpha-trehalase
LVFVYFEGDYWFVGVAAWPPLQYQMIRALEASPNPVHGQLAREVARKSLRSIFCGWIRTGGLLAAPSDYSKGIIFEKYHVEDIGKPGGGGEYLVQSGFGWTNGIALVLLTQYPDAFTNFDETTCQQ